MKRKKKKVVDKEDLWRNKGGEPNASTVEHSDKNNSKVYYRRFGEGPWAKR